MSDAEYPKTLPTEVCYRFGQATQEICFKKSLQCLEALKEPDPHFGGVPGPTFSPGKLAGSCAGITFAHISLCAND